MGRVAYIFPTICIFPEFLGMGTNYTIIFRNMKNLMIGVSGVRGLVDSALTPDVISNFSRAFGSFLGGGKVVVGRDTRPSGEMCRHALLAGLIYAGCEVVDLGICPTPTVIWMVKEMGASGGVAVTASHNPVEWNAMKFVGGDASFLDGDAMKEFLEKVDRIFDGESDGMKPGTLELCSDGIDSHIDGILGLDMLDLDQLRKRRFRVALDCCNGAGSVMTPRLLEQMGCEVLPLFCELDGAFPRNPEPVAGNLDRLAGFVKEMRADVGMALDPDADRLSLVDETGEALGEEMTLALAARFVLGKKRGPVAANLSTSMMIDDIALEFGVDVHRTRVGEINVSRCLAGIGGVVGGEGNGGVILPELHYTRDAPLAVALILQHMADMGKELSALSSELSKYEMVKGKIELKTGREVDLAAIRDEYPEADIDEEDGLKLMWAREWVHIRKSGTEPIVRIIAEAEGKERVSELYNEFKRKIEGGS
jgi:phosphomannomutase